jgi:hypothetical protein
MESIWKWLAIPGAILALIGVWTALGFPKPATSADINRLDRQQAEVAIDVYTTKRNGLMLSEPPKDTQAHKIWEQQLNDANDQLKRAEDREIELSK